MLESTDSDLVLNMKKTNSKNVQFKVNDNNSSGSNKGSKKFRKSTTCHSKS